MTSESEELMNKTAELNLNRELYTNTRSHFIGILSPKSKHLLTLPKEERSGDAVSNLLAEMENIELFKMFHSTTREALAKTLRFVTHRADELLLVQGETMEPPQALYIIVSGVVTEHYKPLITNEDKILATDNASMANIWPEKILRKGEFFGHVDIVHGRPPAVDAQTVGYCELLLLPREDFHVVRKEMEDRCSRIDHFLRTTEAITRFNWSDEEYKVLQIYSKLCTFYKDEDIYCGVEDNKPIWSYFVVSGECRIVRELSYHVTDSGQKKAVPRKETKNSRVTTERLAFEEVRQGYYFGVGERFCGNHVIASSTLECLVVPRLLLVFKNRKMLRKMAKDLTDSLPSDQEVLDAHTKLVAVSKKKEEMLKELLEHKPHVGS